MNGKNKIEGLALTGLSAYSNTCWKGQMSCSSDFIFYTTYESRYAECRFAREVIARKKFIHPDNYKKCSIMLRGIGEFSVKCNEHFVHLMEQHALKFFNLFVYQCLLLLRDIWWYKLQSIFKCCSFFQH